ncbi:hypothetical protein [Aestuariivivens sediminicola]|uniref:hypothetical protein n=1 Tax=Aestuariivivens sediminicola TaxID=2913560 RepID=UPI001F58A15E|nr:hypothetical protein [Aestuariivivens sediminicola]
MALIRFSKYIQISLFIILCSCNDQTLTLTSLNGELKFEFEKNGAFKSILDHKRGINYLDASEASYLMSIRIDSSFHYPEAMVMRDSVITLKYASDMSAKIRYAIKDDYFTFELKELHSAKPLDLITWGPYPTTIGDVIGETVGVVRNDEFALGIQSLNLKTLGGFPYQENDCMPEFDAFSQDDITNVDTEDQPHVLYRIEAAKPTQNGSSLQTYCRNRHRDRIIENLGHDLFLAPKYDDGGVKGSKIAFFGVSSEKVLETIGEIEIAEGLPHPVKDGKWMKLLPEAAASYIIMNFSEDNIDAALEVTQKAGLKHLYHYGKTFDSWGHFKLFEDQFPNGYDGLKTCVEKAKNKGISLGIHTLSNFITTNDPYVTPIPDKRLAEVGRSIITADLDEHQTDIPIASPEYFNQFKNNNLKTVRINDELIRYGTVSKEAPWMLLDCQRGAFNTARSGHKKGTAISKLLDHSYKVFLSNTELTKEISKNIANLYNETGLKQISFDGLEGNKSTGLGNYGESMMPYVWYENLKEELKDGLIIDASRTTHFFWHIYTRMNWGEPWYAGFRESQTEYRMKNQPYFRRNFMPGMLGWFQMTSEISLEDLEWMLARSAAFDAGYAFITSEETLNTHGQSDAILNLVKQWEAARLGGAFPKHLKKEMEDLNNEYHLENRSENSWHLFPTKYASFNHTQKVRQPGEPLHTAHKFENPYTEQPIQITIKLAEETVCKNIVVELDNYKKIEFPITLSDNQILRYEGGDKATVYDQHWNAIKTITMEDDAILISNGSHTLTADCTFLSGKASEIHIELKTFGEPTVLNTTN